MTLGVMRTPRHLTSLALMAMLALLAVGVLDSGAVAARGQPCTATGADPTKQAIHVNRRGKAKKLKKPENSGKLFGKKRVDRQKEDQERNFAEIVRISGYSATVTTAGFVQSVGDFEEAGYIKLSVKICNRDEEAQAFSIGDWRLQTPAGTVIDSAFVVGAPTLAIGEDLVEGGEVAGDVYFEVGGERGEFFILYKPDPFDASRGIWKVTV